MHAHAKRQKKKSRNDFRFGTFFFLFFFESRNFCSSQILAQEKIVMSVIQSFIGHFPSACAASMAVKLLRTIRDRGAQDVHLDFH